MTVLRRQVATAAVRTGITGLAVLAAFTAAGCQAPGGDRAPTPMEVAQMPLETDIVGICALYDPVAPWIWNEDRSRVHGLVVRALYLFGPDETAVFGDGIIHPKLFVIERDQEGRSQARLVKEWSFDVQDALLLRSKRKKGPGWGYLLPLDWADLDLAGKQIRMLVAFERGDGIIVKTQSQKDFRVPRSAR